MDTNHQVVLISNREDVIERVQTTLEQNSAFSLLCVISPEVKWTENTVLQDCSLAIYAPDHPEQELQPISSDQHDSTVQPKILACSTSHTPKLVKKALASGASGFIADKFLSSHLVTAMHFILQGELYIKTTTDYTPESMNQEHGAIFELSDREIDVLQMISYGYTYQDIAKKLEISDKSVETYRARISQKLNLTSRAKMVRFALDHDLLSKDQHI